MAKFSVSYSGIANVEGRLHQLFKKVDGISNNIYTAANKISKAKSLENKGYAATVREHGRKTSEEASAIGTQGSNLNKIGDAYSDTERRVLELLDEAITRGSFSSESAGIVRDALKTHRIYQRNDNVGRTVDDILGGGARGTKDLVEQFRYWRSTTGSDWVKKGTEWLFGENGLENPVVSEAIKDINKEIEKYENIVNGALNFTNADARAEGVKALASTKLMKLLGVGNIGGFLDMVPRYADYFDAISNSASEIWAQGDKAKAVCYTMSAATLTTFQFVGDAAYNSAKYLVSTVTSDFFGDGMEAAKKGKASKRIIRSWEIGKEGTGKVRSMSEDGIEGYFDAFGDWCWSRLDEAYGI